MNYPANSHALARVADISGPTYKTILVDPPWPLNTVGSFKGRQKRPTSLPYSTMSVDEISTLPVSALAADDAHLWLWTTNAFLHDAFHVIENWGFHFMAPITWVKPSGFGAWWVHRTQTMLFAYNRVCRFNLHRFKPTVIFAPASRHSRKPACAHELVEAVSSPPRIELFARQESHLFASKWDLWGDEVR